MIENTHTQDTTTNTHTVTQNTKMAAVMTNNVVEMHNDAYYNDIYLLQEFVLETEYYGDYYMSDAEHARLEEIEREDEEKMLRDVQTHGFLDFSNNCDVFDVCSESGYCDY